MPNHKTPNIDCPRCHGTGWIPGPSDEVVALRCPAGCPEPGKALPGLEMGAVLVDTPTRTVTIVPFED